MESGDPLVTAEWLKQNLSSPDLRIVDATWVPPFLVGRKSGRECYDEGHIPGAIYFDIDDIADPNTELSHMLPDPSLFSAKVGALGLGDGYRIIVYDSNGFFASARVWWMFRAMGHTDIKVLDGGLKAWEAVGGKIEDLSSPRAERFFTPRHRPALVRSMDQMRRHVAASDLTILDARDQGRFDGTAPEPRKGLPSGHMPGSACVPTSGLMNPDGTMKSAEVLNDSLGAFTSGPVVTTCGSGVSAAVITLALARLGHWEAAVYDGSWSEWAADPANPIATAP
ncbi:MAG: sulfurtransferase [Pseudomonadota bacterium]